MFFLISYYTGNLPKHICIYDHFTYNLQLQCHYVQYMIYYVSNIRFALILDYDFSRITLERVMKYVCYDEFYHIYCPTSWYACAAAAVDTF